MTDQELGVASAQERCPQPDAGVAATFDTSGAVYFPSVRADEAPVGLRWVALSPFTQGYVEALFADLSAQHHARAALKVGDKVRVHTDEVGTISRIIPGKLKSIQVSFADGGGQYFPFECSDAPLAFSDLAPETLARIMADCARWRSLYPNGDTGTKGGANMWLLRTEQMVERKDFPPLTPYLGDDGKVYLRASS